LVGAYGWLLLKGANLISDGGEALLDAGLAPSLIGGLVLPVMGALPDTLIVLASGFHGAAAHGRHPRRALREQVDVGVGALVGSTVMLLTIVFGGSIMVGRCEADKRTGRAVDRQPPTLDEAWMPRWLRENAEEEEEHEAEERGDVERGGGAAGNGLAEALLPSSSGGRRHQILARRLASLCRRSIRTLIAQPLLLLFAGAVSTDARTPAAARVMAASTLLWLFAELPVLLTSWWSSPATPTLAAASSWASLIGAILCFAALVVYCLSHVLLPHSAEAEAAAAAVERGAARHYYLAAHRHALRVRAVRSFAWAAGHRHGGLVDAQGRVRPEATLALFRRFDRDGSGAIDRAELRALIMGLEIARPGLAGSSADAPPRLLPVVVGGGGAQGAAADKQGAAAAAAAAKALGHPLLSDAELDAHVRAWMREFDRDRSGGIDYGEFHNGIERWVAYKRRAYAARRRQQEEKAQQQQDKEAGAAAKERQQQQQQQQQAPPAGVVAVVVVPSGQEDDAAAPGSPAPSAGGRHAGASADEASGSGAGDEQPPSQEQQQPPQKKKKTEAEKAARREAKLRAVDPVGAETAALAALDGDDADPAGMAIPSLRRASSSGGGGGGAAGSAAALTSSSPSAAAAAALTAALLRQQCGEEEVGEDGVALCFVDEDDEDDEQEEEEEDEQRRRRQRQAAANGNAANALELLSPTSLSRGSSGADHHLPLSSSPSAADANGPLALTSSSGDSSSSDSGDASGPRSLCATLALSAAWFAAGTLLCAAFAGPLVNSLGDLATATRIPSFTLSFFLAPLASNASELVSSLRFAAGRRASRISATFSQVYGAVVMNHTMVLGALLAVVHYRNLALGDYAGQAVLMVLPTLAVGWLGAARTTFQAWLGPVLLAVYPLALGVQYAFLGAGGQAAGP
jgi:Ca2+/Na+ antiporter